MEKKEKQNATRDRNMEEWKVIQGLLDKICSTGMGGFSADDPQAVQKLESKLEKLKKAQETYQYQTEAGTIKQRYPYAVKSDASSISGRANGRKVILITVQ